jgi:hypothetical protein
MQTKSYKFLFFIFIVYSVISFSKDSYIYDQERIKNALYNWELTHEEQGFMRLTNREDDMEIQISSYKKGDTKEKAKERFDNINKKNNLAYSKYSDFAENILGIGSEQWVRMSARGNVKLEQFFFDNVKFNIYYTGSLEEYLSALMQVKKAIDPKIPLESRTRINFSKNYSIDNFIDKDKLIALFEEQYKIMTFVEEKGNANKMSCYKITVDKEPADRYMFIMASNNYSKKVIERIWNSFLEDNEELDPSGKLIGYKYYGEEKKIAKKYFGVNAQIYKNSYYKENTNLKVVAVYHHIIADKFDIAIRTFEIDGNKKYNGAREYEDFLNRLNASLK